MVNNLLENIKLKQHPVALSVTFPDVLNRMRADDANFELSVSNTIQRLKLYHKDSMSKPYYPNTINESIGLIFVNTHSKDLVYEPKVPIVE